MSKKTKTLPELEADLVILKGRLQVLTAKDDLNNALRRRVTKQIQNLETEISKMKRFDVNIAAPSAKAAAVKLQSVQRGRVGRANAADDELKARFARLTGQPAAKEAVAKTRPSSPPPNVAPSAKAAAVKLQSVQRGRVGRANAADDELKARFARLTGQPAAKEAVAKTRPSSPPPNVAAKAAATKLQAFQRGRQTRKSAAAAKAAATKLQAFQRRKQTRKANQVGGKRTRRRGGERNRKRGGRRTRK